MEIKILNADTTNKIAAGEIISSPIDIIKELVENSIDANSSKIDVSMIDGGKKSLTVSDDGKGIASDDVLLAFERHATSKIEELDDLLSLCSLGFRGEALASIAAISKVSMKTQSSTENVGSYVRISSSGEDIVRRTFSQGTSITVEDIFYNTPARLKHLGKGSEIAKHIIKLMEDLALSYPNISFSLTSDDRVVFKTPGDGVLLNCIYSIFGNEFGNNLFEMDYSNKPLMINGYLGNIDYTKSNRKCQHIFVNRRFVKDIHISKAVEEAYNKFIMVNQHPVFILNISLPSNMIDVNVHPSKTQIKIQNESLILLLIKDGVMKAIREKTDIKKIEIDKNPFVFKDSKITEKDNVSDTISIPMDISFDDVQNRAGSVHQNDLDEYETAIEPEKNTVKEEKPNIRDIIKQAKFVGQIFSTYLLYQREDSIIILDQHAAHERVLYEEISKKVKDEDNISQSRIPENLKLSPSEYQVLMNNSAVFERIGYEFEDFGDNTICIRAEPVFLYRKGDSTVLKDILDEIGDRVGNDEFAVIEDQVIRKACKMSVKANQKLNEEEIKTLIDKLARCQYSYTCPHGRPILLEVTKREFEKHFKRVL